MLQWKKVYWLTRLENHFRLASKMLRSRGCWLLRRLPSSSSTGMSMSSAAVTSVPDKLYQKIDLELRCQWCGHNAEPFLWPAPGFGNPSFSRLKFLLWRIKNAALQHRSDLFFFQEIGTGSDGDSTPNNARDWLNVPVWIKILEEKI